MHNPTVISFLQGYSSQADNRYLNVYALGGGELTLNYHYFINGDEYHCVEVETGVTKSTRSVTTDYVVYEFNGHEIDAIYNMQTECAKRGANPHRCVIEWN